jgi:hypothetical protein
MDSGVSWNNVLNGIVCSIIGQGNDEWHFANQRPMPIRKDQTIVAPNQLGNGHFSFWN